MNRILSAPAPFNHNVEWFEQRSALHDVPNIRTAFTKGRAERC